MENLDPSFAAAVQYFFPALGAALSVLLSEAQKYIFTPLWNTNEFLISNALPLALNLGLALGVYFILVYAPGLKPVLEEYAGAPLIVSSAGIFGFSQAIIKGWLQPKKTINDIEVVE